MKKLITAIVCAASLSSFAQNTKPGFDGASWKAPYSLATPGGWSVERSVLSTEKANRIPYKGVEDLRLTPGWNNPTSEEYWTYASLWYFDGINKPDEETIEHDLNSYFTGLLNKNIETQKIPARKILPVKTWITELKNENGDSKTFYGAVAMLDYKEQMPISLNCLVHVRLCPGQNKTFVFYEFSPKPLNDKVWKSLDQLWLDFNVISNQPYSTN
jgi:hypothetical protein